MTDEVIKPALPPDNYGDIELLVIGGSQAYGLATPDSDFDYKGVYSADVKDVLTLGVPKERRSWVSHDPADIAMHEIQHFVHLALSCNPNILEVLAIDDEQLVITSSPLADDLRSEIDRFFHVQGVKDAYGGYAASQFHRLQNRSGTFSADTAKRTAKHARHLLRLIWQGEGILLTGKLRVQVTPDERARLFEFGELPYEEMVTQAEAELARFDAIETRSRVLRDEPDTETIANILYYHRRRSVS